jgi:hypothetical protein
MGAGQLLLWGGLVFGQPGDLVEVAPPPRPATPVAVRAVAGGYQIALSRSAAEFLRDALANADEKQLAQALRDEAKRRKETAEPPDPDTAAKLELVAFVVSWQLPAFKKAMRENLGPHGVVITVSGLQAPAIQFRKPRPKLERAAQALRAAMPLLPEEARDALEAMRAVGRTTPLSWRVEPRE